MNKNYITCNILDKENIINLYTTKPLNFNIKTTKKEQINNNYNNIEKDLNYKFNKIIKPNQTHTNNLKIVTKENINNTFENVDGLITNIEGIALITSLADCQGILLYDPINKVIGNIHSGWKGTLNKIVINAIELMKKEFNSNPKNIKVYITPSIDKCCFEVDEDVKNLFLKNFNCKEEIYLGNIKDNKQKYYIDTKTINKKLLLKEGIKEQNIQISNECTKCNYKKYHSYRKDKELSGRNIALICMKEKEV